MQIIHDPRQFQNACLDARRGGGLGFVPTMGFLHEGHATLLRRAAEHHTAVLSIFVNPSQFGPKEDLARYPRNLEGDLAIARRCGVELVFTPEPASIYPPGFDTWVTPGALGDTLEGPARPGHFRGVATVVLKLLQLAQPTHAYFGQKDFQQLAIVRRMVRDLDLPLEIVGVPTVREADGLAMSSRNVYLKDADRQKALCLSKGLRAAREAVERGETDPKKVEAAALAEVQQGATKIDYVAVRDPDTLQEPARISGPVVVLIAAFVGTTRLIDNEVVSPRRA